MNAFVGVINTNTQVWHLEILSIYVYVGLKYESSAAMKKKKAFCEKSVLMLLNFLPTKQRQNAESTK